MHTKFFIIAFTIILILITPFSISGETQVNTIPSESQRMIQTYGEAELTAQPDLARISLAIETRSNSAEKAVYENARMANAVRESLLDSGLSEDNLKTSSYRLSSYRDWQKEQSDTEDEKIYYQATNEILVSTNQLDRIGKIIDTAVKAGANNINYINFEIEDPQDLMIQALGMATQQAYRKANAIAESAGETIVKLYSIREERTVYTPFRFQESMVQRGMTSDVAPTPITPDEVIVMATVIAEFSF